MLQFFDATKWGLWSLHWSHQELWSLARRRVGRFETFAGVVSASLQPFMPVAVDTAKQNTISMTHEFSAFPPSPAAGDVTRDSILPHCFPSAKCSVLPAARYRGTYADGSEREVEREGKQRSGVAGVEGEEATSRTRARRRRHEHGDGRGNMEVAVAEKWAAERDVRWGLRDGWR